MIAIANPSTEKIQKPPPRRRRKTMNLNTYKVHALGDYVETIRKYGTIDSYSTELVSVSYYIYNGANGPWLITGRIRTPDTQV